MMKLIQTLVLAICVYGVQSQCERQCNPLDAEICAADIQIVNCRRMTQCQMDNENCRLRAANSTILSNVAEIRCRSLESPGGSGSCTPAHRLKRNARPECNRLRCINPSPIHVCVRSKNNLCQRLTNCQLQRHNCRHDHRNHLELAHPRLCAGMSPAQKLQKCKRMQL